MRTLRSALVQGPVLGFSQGRIPSRRLVKARGILYLERMSEMLTPLELRLDLIRCGACDFIAEFEDALWRVVQRERRLERSSIPVRPMTPEEQALAP